MQQSNDVELKQEMKIALQKINESIEGNPELSAHTKQRIRDIMNIKFKHAWKAKYDLHKPATLPPMKIELKPGAKPSKVRRHYRWTQEQRQFLRKLLRKLVNTGVISRVDSEWCCPVVLVIKPDLTWRLCVDPSVLNAATKPMTWAIPKNTNNLLEKSISAFFTEMCQKSKSPTCLLFMCSTKQLIPSVLYIWTVLTALMEIENVELHQKNGNFEKNWLSDNLQSNLINCQHFEVNISIWSSGNRTSFLARPGSYSESSRSTFWCKWISPTVEKAKN